MNSDDKYVLIGLSKYAKIVRVCIQVILTSVNIALQLHKYVLYLYIAFQQTSICFIICIYVHALYVV